MSLYLFYPRISPQNFSPLSSSFFSFPVSSELLSTLVLTLWTTRFSFSFYYNTTQKHNTKNKSRIQLCGTLQKHTRNYYHILSRKLEVGAKGRLQYTFTLLKITSTRPWLGTYLPYHTSCLEQTMSTWPLLIPSLHSILEGTWGEEKWQFVKHIIEMSQKSKLWPNKQRQNMLWYRDLSVSKCC